MKLNTDNLNDLLNDVHRNDVGTISIKDIEGFTTFTSELLTLINKEVNEHLKLYRIPVSGKEYAKKPNYKIVIPYWDEELALVEKASIGIIYINENKIIKNKIEKILKKLTLNSFTVVKLMETRNKKRYKNNDYVSPIPLDEMSFETVTNVCNAGIEIKNKTGKYEIEPYMAFSDNIYFKITKIKETNSLKTIIIEATITVKNIEDDECMTTFIKKFEKEVKSISISGSCVSDFDYEEYEEEDDEY